MAKLKDLLIHTPSQIHSRRLVVRSNWMTVGAIWIFFLGFGYFYMPLSIVLSAGISLKIPEPALIPGLAIMIASLLYGRHALIMDETGLRIRSAVKDIWLPWDAIEGTANKRAISVTYRRADGSTETAKSWVFAGSQRDAGSPHKRARTVAEINQYLADVGDNSTTSGHEVRISWSKPMIWLVLLFFFSGDFLVPLISRLFLKQ